MNAASADGPAASGSAGGGSWAAYDTTMQGFVTCMHEHGKTGVRYEGHMDTAYTFYDELSGMPSDPVAVVPVGGSPASDALTVCLQTAFGGRAEPGNRPQPYAQPTAAPEERAKNQAFSRCMREHGIADYPDPDPGVGTVTSFPPRYGTDDERKAGSKELVPGLDAAAEACSAQTGANQHEGG